MDYIKKSEKMIREWLKPVPDLPKAGQKWLAENVWWLALISAILSAISILFAIGAIISYATWSGAVTAMYGVYTVSPYGNGWILRAVVSLLFTIVTTVLTAAAITPLKEMRYRGWGLLLTILLLNALNVLLTAILTLSVGGFILQIIFGAIGLAIGAYFLFQIRESFGNGVKTPKK